MNKTVTIKNLIKELAGSLVIPKRWQGKSIERIIKESKEKYFYVKLIKEFNRSNQN